MKLQVKANLKKAQRDIGIDPWGNDREVQKADRGHLKEIKSKVIQFAYQLLQSWGLAGKRIADLFSDPQLKKYSYKIRTEIENFLKQHNLLDTFKQNYGNNISDWFAGPQPVIARTGKLHIKATVKRSGDRDLAFDEDFVNWWINIHGDTFKEHTEQEPTYEVAQNYLRHGCDDRYYQSMVKEYEGYDETSNRHSFKSSKRNG